VNFFRLAAEDLYVTSATKKPVAKKSAAKKAPAVKKAPAAKKVVAKQPVVAKKVPARKPAAKRVAAVVAAPVVAAPVVATPPAPKVATAKPLVAKERARRKVVLPFRERVEEAMHRELKHVGPVCHACRMNGSRLAALASMPAVVAV